MKPLNILTVLLLFTCGVFSSTIVKDREFKDYVDILPDTNSVKLRDLRSVLQYGDAIAIFYVNGQTCNATFSVLSDPTHPWCDIQSAIDTGILYGFNRIFITLLSASLNTGGVHIPFDIKGQTVYVNSNGQTLIAPFIDSLGSRTGGLTLLGATVVIQPSTPATVNLKNITLVDSNFVHYSPIDLTDIWWTSSRSTYTPLGLQSNQFIARAGVALENVFDVVVLYDGFQADPVNGFTVFEQHDNGDITTASTYIGFEFGYRSAVSDKIIVSASYNALSPSFVPGQQQTYGQVRHTGLTIGFNKDVNPISQIVFAAGTNSSIQYYGFKCLRVREYLTVQTQYILNNITGRSLLEATDFFVDGQIKVDYSNPQLNLKFFIGSSKGSLNLAGGIQASIKTLNTCGSEGRVYFDDYTVKLNNCNSNTVRILSEAFVQGKLLNIKRLNPGQVRIIADSATIDNKPYFDMWFLSSLSLQYDNGNWEILSYF